MPQGIGYSPTSLASRRRRGLTQAKAKKISGEGLKSAGNGFHSTAQKNFIGMVAGGATPTRTRKRRRKRAKKA